MMPLTQQQLLTMWERGRSQHPVDQALTVLSFACRHQTRSELAEWSIGQRDFHLLALREGLFGEILNCDAVCPDCKEPVSLAFATKEVRTPSKTPEQQKTELTWNDCQIGFRLPNSRDLAAIAGCANDGSARRILIERCLVNVIQNEVPIAAIDLPQDAIRITEQTIADCDPQAEILLDLKCPECGTQWQLLFDIARFLWTEIAAETKRLLREIHTLAKAYGWTETQILELSEARRQIYLEMTSA